jgi:hypothetical protein
LPFRLPRKKITAQLLTVGRLSDNRTKLRLFTLRPARRGAPAGFSGGRA